MKASDGLVSSLRSACNLPDAELAALLRTDEFDWGLFSAAHVVRKSVYGDEVYICGLIEFTNYCKNNCYYCGIRCGNTLAIKISPEKRRYS